MRVEDGAVVADPAVASSALASPVVASPALASSALASSALASPALASSARAALAALHPWRKGPFRIAGVDIDTEWRSDWKWDRIAPHLSPLRGRSVLDVGCGSGYHLWRMREAGAAAALGIEPALLYVCQFEAVARCAPDAAVACLPLPLDALPALPASAAFDTAFSMGVLYHRADVGAHLSELRAALRPGGELVLETLVLDRSLDGPLPDDGLDIAATPSGRYARMRNVHELPSVARLRRQLEAAGFEDVRAVSVALTSIAEQRTTCWMRFESLDAALVPSGPDGHDDPGRRTVEGWPRPVRATLVARRA